MKYTSHKKIIPYQIVIDFQKHLEALNSLEEYLSPLKNYFSLSDHSDQQKIMTDYPINQLIFADFFQEYLEVLTKLQTDLKKIKHSEAIKPIPIV